MQDSQNQQVQQNDNSSSQVPFVGVPQDQANGQTTVPNQDPWSQQTSQPQQAFNPVNPVSTAQAFSPLQDSQQSQTINPMQTTNPAQNLSSPQGFDSTQTPQQAQPVDPSVVQPQTPVSVHTGTPESAPVPVAAEAMGDDNIEYGYEKVRQIENAGLELEKIENKESLGQKPQDELQVEPKQQDIPAELPPVKPTGPKIFGYYIPDNITSNLSDVRAKKGTGDPQEARTWIFVLLDKLLKKQTYQQSGS